MIMSNHANEAALEQIAEEVMELTVGDFLEELRHRKLPVHPQAQAVVNELITERFFERAQ